MSYHRLSSGVSLVFLALCCALIFLPEIVYWLFSLQGNDVGDFLAKRAGVLFLGLSALCFFSRNTTSREVMNTVAISVGITMGAIALLGIYEWRQENAGTGILVAVIIEMLIAALFFRVWMTNRPTQ